MENFADPGFTRLRTLDNKESAGLLNYLLNQGKQLKDKLVKEYTSVLLEELESKREDISARRTRIF